jgi:zinc protease
LQQISKKGVTLHPITVMQQPNLNDMKKILSTILLTLIGTVAMMAQM